jgi:hypothetical protein
MNKTYPSETSVNFQHITGRYVVEDTSIALHVGSIVRKDNFFHFILYRNLIHTLYNETKLMKGNILRNRESRNLFIVELGLFSFILCCKGCDLMGMQLVR